MFPPEPIAIRDLELGHLGRNVQKRNSPRKEIPQELSLGESRNGNDDSPRKPEFLGNGEFPRNEGPEIKGIKKRNAQPSYSDDKGKYICICKKCYYVEVERSQWAGHQITIEVT